MNWWMIESWALVISRDAQIINISTLFSNTTKKDCSFQSISKSTKTISTRSVCQIKWKLIPMFNLIDRKFSMTWISIGLWCATIHDMTLLETSIMWLNVYPKKHVETLFFLNVLRNTTFNDTNIYRTLLMRMKLL